MEIATVQKTSILIEVYWKTACSLGLCKHFANGFIILGHTELKSEFKK